MKIGIISTSANPLHEGHLDMARWGDKNDYHPIFDISRNNADKGMLDDIELNRRNAQVINSGYDVINLDEGSFVYKIREIRKKVKLGRLNFQTEGLHFFVGYDTILRIDDLKYYGNKENRFRLLNVHNPRFVVFERNGGKDLSILSAELRQRCIIAGGFVNRNLSSTEIRNGRI